MGPVLSIFALSFFVKRPRLFLVMFKLLLHFFNTRRLFSHLAISQIDVLGGLPIEIKIC